MKKTLLYMTMAAAMLAACSNDDALESAQPKELKIGYTIDDGSSNLGTRASLSQYNIIQRDRDVFIWAVMHTEDEDHNPKLEDYFKAWNVKSNGGNDATGGTFYSTKPKMFTMENQVDFYGFHGRFADGQIVAETTPLPCKESAKTNVQFSVDTDQTTDDNYYASDLMYSALKKAEPSSNAVVMPFYHMLSQIRIYLEPGANLTINDISKAKVQLLDAYYQGTLAPDTASAKSITDPTNGQANRASIVNTNTGFKSNILLKDATTGAFHSDTAGEYVVGIICPGNYSGSFIRITTPDPEGGTNDHIFDFVLDGTLVCKSGYSYCFKLTINDGYPMTLTPTLTKWVEDNSYNVNIGRIF